GYIDKTGQVVIPLRYRLAHDFHEGLAAVMLPNDEGHGDQLGFIDRNGEVVIPAQFEGADDFCAGVARVETHRLTEDVFVGGHTQRFHGKHGIIDHSGHYIWRDAEEQTWLSGYVF